jgi:hypothetical protein
MRREKAQTKTREQNKPKKDSSAKKQRPLYLYFYPNFRPPSIQFKSNPTQRPHTTAQK